MPEGIAVVRRDLMVNLFEPSLAPLHAMHALAFYNRDPERHATLEQIRVHLGISKRSADLALQLGRKLRAAGLSDPFVELTARPENAARWRPKK